MIFTLSGGTRVGGVGVLIYTLVKLCLSSLNWALRSDTGYYFVFSSGTCSTGFWFLVSTSFYIICSTAFSTLGSISVAYCGSGSDDFSLIASAGTV